MLSVEAPPWELPGGLVCARESIFVIPGVDCLGCLLGHRTLKPVVDALRRNAAHLPEEAWPAAGLAAYEGLRDVLRRSRHDDLCRYQAERRCGCAPRKGSRDGCFFVIDGQFETQLAAFSPAGARFYISHGLDTLLGHLREVLQIPPNAKLMRRPDRVVVYGWSSLS